MSICADIEMPCDTDDDCTSDTYDQLDGLNSECKLVNFEEDVYGCTIV